MNVNTEFPTPEASAAAAATRFEPATAGWDGAAAKPTTDAGW